VIAELQGQQQEDSTMVYLQASIKLHPGKQQDFVVMVSKAKP
jgi:hypothetical protein